MSRRIPSEEIGEQMSRPWRGAPSAPSARRSLLQQMTDGARATAPISRWARFRAALRRFFLPIERPAQPPYSIIESDRRKSGKVEPFRFTGGRRA